MPGTEPSSAAAQLASWKIAGPIIAGVVILAIAFWLYWQLFSTYHLSRVRSGVLYRDGVRSLREFAHAIQKSHIKTVVSLVDDREIAKPPFTDELAYCKTSGIEVVRIPITLGGWPDGDQIPRFLAIAQDPSRQPVLVHCAQGVRRTGMMVAAYQESVMGFSADQSLAAMLSFGHSQRTVGDVRRFIQTYDPKGQKMTTQLPPSEE